MGAGAGKREAEAGEQPLAGALASSVGEMAPEFELPHNATDDTARREQKEAQNTETYTPDFMIRKITQLLQANNNISEVKKLEIIPRNGEIILRTSVVAKGNNVGVEAVLQNLDDGVAIKGKPEIKAGFLVKVFAEGIISKKLGEVSEMLKEYIEQDSGKKVEKMEIVDEGLKVKFRE